MEGGVELPDALPRPRPRPTVAEWCQRMLVFVGPRRIAGAVVGAAAVAVGGWWLLHAPAPPVERSLPLARTTVVVEPATSAPTVPAVAEDNGSDRTLVVHVAGAVRAPGLVHLPSGARVADALAAAGGGTPEALLDALNLAAPVEDGVRIYVPKPGEDIVVTASAQVGPVPAGGGQAELVDLNTASAAELEQLPGVGPATAAAIVAHRQARGPFRTVDDLLDVHGIGPAKLEQFRALVVV